MRRRLRRPLRRLRRRMRIRRPLSKRALNTYHFKRTFAGSPVSSSTSPVFGAYTLQFSNLPNNSDFTNLFDMYRINKIVVKWVPNHDASEIGSTKGIPDFHSVLDFTDGNAPTSLNEMYEYQSWRMTRGTRIHTRSFIPSVLIDALEITPNQASAPKFKQWISTAQTDVAFLGVKYAVGATTASADVSFTPYVTYYYSCKSVK